jgi:hypothetical protein
MRLQFIIMPPLPEGGGGILFYLCPSVLPSVRPRYFSSHFSQYHIVGSVFGPVRFLLPVCRLSWFFIHIEHICTFFVTFFSATINGRDLIFGHKLHIGTPYCGKCFLTHQIPTSCLPKSGGIISEH